MRCSSSACGRNAMRRSTRRRPRRSSSSSCVSATGRRRWARNCAACGSPRALSKWLLLAALAALALAQEPPEAEAEQAPPPIFAPERPPSAEQERPPTGQPDPAGILHQDRSPREAPAPLPQDRALMLQTGGSVAWDSNIFRLSEPQAERIVTAYVGLRLDKSYRQQRWYLDVTETAY